MSDFMIRFLICNILFCGIISILLLMKHILKNCLSSRMQYNLWFLLLGLLTVPFLPSHFFKFSELFFGFTNLKFLPSAATKKRLGSTTSHEHRRRKRIGWMTLRSP